jgi:hypothetical protein
MSGSSLGRVKTPKFIATVDLFERTETHGSQIVRGPSFSLRQFVHIPVISITRDFGVKAAACVAASMAEENSVGKASRAVPHRSQISTMITSASPYGHMQ